MLQHFVITVPNYVASLELVLINNALRYKVIAFVPEGVRNCQFSLSSDLLLK